MNKLRKKWYHFLKNERKACGALLGLVCFLMLLFEFLSPGHLGTIDTGKYEVIMKEAGLKYTQEELQSGRPLTYDHVIEEYDYGHFAYAKLLAPSGIHSVVYPIACIRAVTNPFGILFSLKYLYFLYALLAAVCVAVITRGVAGICGTPLGCIAGAALTLLLADGNLNAYFASLYDVGTVVIGLLLVMASLVRAYSYRKEAGAVTVVPVILSLMFLLNASTLSIVFLPFAVLAGILIVKKEWMFFRHKKMTACMTGFLLITGIVSGMHLMSNNPDIQSDASVYFCAFQGFLEASDDPKKDLAEFGLDEDYAEDIGKSYYLEEDEYQHNPRDPKEAEKLFSKLNRESILKWYLKNPKRIIQTAVRQKENFASLESQLLLKPGQNTEQTNKTFRNWSIVDMFLAVCFPTNYSGAWILLVSGAIFVVLAVILQIKKKIHKLNNVILFFLWELGTLGYIPAHLFFMGRDTLELSRVSAVFAMIVTVGGLALLVGRCCVNGTVWFQKLQAKIITEEKENLYEEDVETSESRTDVTGLSGICVIILQRMKKGIMVIASNRRKTVLLVSAIAAVMAGMVLFATPRAGCVNNGDFGRMMDQLGIIWQGDIFYDVDAQLGRRVIENYAYRETFQPAALTFLSPKYSLIYPATVVRGISAVLDQPFSTYWLSIIMTILLLICLISIVRDLYVYLGRYTLLLGIGLCIIFLCESYLVWFNSLFGESMIFLGTFMVLACGIHLSIVPKGKGVLSVFIMLFACHFLVCAKAQMLVTLPILLVMICIFALYHRPLRLGRLITYTIVIILGMGIISYEGVKVYQDNSHISERQTLWQAVFYGALMVSDDPIDDMKELGIDVRMAADIGKDAYQPDDDYVISPNSKEADAAFYDHVTTGTLVKYYLKRPKQLIKMMNHAANVSQELYNGFRAYLGQDYAGEHDTVDRLGLWLYWRPVFTFSTFWGYVLVYGSLLIASIYIMLQKQTDIQKKLLAGMYVAVMMIGVIQYPLSVVGNGFADNQKQMFGFMLCHDILTVITGVLILKFMWKYREQLTWKNVREKRG